MTYVTLAALIGVMFGLSDLSWIAIAAVLVAIAALVALDVSRRDKRPEVPTEHHHVTVVRRPPYDWEKDPFPYQAPQVTAK